MADPMAVPVTALVFSMAAGLVALFACFSTRRASITACRFAATLQENSWAKDYKQLNILGAAIAGYVFSDDSVTLNFKADPAGNSAAIQSMTELITFIHSIYAHNVGRHLCSSHFQRWEDYTATLKILQHLYKDDFYDLPPQNITVAIQPAPSRASVSSGASVAPALTHVSAVLSNDTQPMQKQRLARVVNCFECALRTSTSSHQVRPIASTLRCVSP